MVTQNVRTDQMLLDYIWSGKPNQLMLDCQDRSQSGCGVALWWAHVASFLPFHLFSSLFIIFSSPSRRSTVMLGSSSEMGYFVITLRLWAPGFPNYTGSQKWVRCAQPVLTNSELSTTGVPSSQHDSTSWPPCRDPAAYCQIRPSWRIGTQAQWGK